MHNTIYFITMIIMLYIVTDCLYGHNCPCHFEISIFILNVSNHCNGTIVFLPRMNFRRGKVRHVWGLVLVLRYAVHTPVGVVLPRG